MPILDNGRHERFAQNIVKGQHQSEAYTKAGFKATGNAAEAGASRLLRNAKVAARIAELTEELKDASIADAREVQQFWTAVLRGEITETRVYGKEPAPFVLPPLVADRIKAADSLARAKGIFNRSEGGDDGELAAIAQALGETPDEPV